jgi:DNA-binding LacI/PurR family transcriptional regulator
MPERKRRTSSRPTIRDVAASAEVSVQTVSNLINGRFEQMSDATRGRVEDVMKQLGYHPDVGARGLRSSRTRTLGFLVLDEHMAFLADPLTGLLIAGIGDVARECDFGILVRGARPSAREGDLLKPIRERRIDGAFVLLSGPPKIRRALIESLAETGVEFVIFDEITDDSSILSVRAADRDGGRRLTEHILSRGHRRIAFAAAQVPWPVIEQRFLGYRDALASAGIEPDPQLELFESGWAPVGGAEMARTLLALRDAPTAIVCGSDLLAIAAMRAIRDAGLRIPEDVGVAGFDDFAFAEYVEPPLTTVAVPGYEMGKAAATMLIDQLEGHGPAVRHVVFGVELKARGSV